MKKKEQERKKHFKKQEEELKRNIKAEPQNPVRIYMLGQLYLDHDKQKAFNTFQNCIAKFDELKQQKIEVDEKKLS